MFGVRRQTMVMCALMLAAASTAGAQVIGTYRWQLRPYCNIVTLTVVQEGANFRLEGTDNQCGAQTVAAVRGLAFVNPNNSIGLGFTIIASPAGTPVHVDADLSLQTLNGNWRDDLSGSGPFIFTPGAGIAGAARPVVQPRVHFRVEDLDGTFGVGSTTMAINTWETVHTNVGGGTYNPNAGTYAVPVPGLYLVTATARWQTFAATTGHKCLEVLRNGVGTASACETRSAASSFQTQTVTTVLSLNAGAQVSIGASSVGGSGTVGGSSEADSHFTVTRLQ